MSDKTLWQTTADRVVSTTVTLLVAGFFGILWTGFTRLDDSVAELGSKQAAATEVFSEEVARLRTGLRRLEDLVQEVHFSAGLDIPSVERMNEPSDSDERSPSALKIRQNVQQSIRERAVK
jgi:hypothetical protein